MKEREIERLRRLTNFPALVAYLRDDLDWPIALDDADDLDELFFAYNAAELGIDPRHAVKIEEIKQIRPLVDTQPWGIFYLRFESKRLPVVVLRRILRAFVRKRHSQNPDLPAWQMENLLFVCAQGESDYRSTSFAHFCQREGRAAELRTFSWDSRETHFYYIKHLNLEALRWPKPGDEGDAAAWLEQWGRAFVAEHRYAINKSQELAREMAHHAATIRDLVGDVYAVETAAGPLHRLFDSFCQVLLHDLTPERFADMIAQTITYGLFAAAAESGAELTFERMVELLPPTNPFLKELLAELTAEAVDLEELGVERLVELFRQTDMAAILRDFGRRSGGGREDPVIHFYELFMREYDREQKVKRGEFYTPDPVVSYIVRSVDHLLKTEFGLEDGLADTSVDPETGRPIVQILDPATGTGTFLAHVIDQIEGTVKAKPGADWNAYVSQHLLPRLYGFELMMAPYAIAHMKLGLKLHQTGYDFRSGERLRVYLTNTLEEPVEAGETLGMAGFLSKESNVAARVKRESPIAVIVGNPPYSISSANKSKYIEQMVNVYKTAVRHEQNIQPLSDDYIKFIRFAHDRIERTCRGIIGIITNHAYLSGLIHRGIREELLKSFSNIYILNLHGNAITGEVSPDGSKDENVFEIRQGVAIIFLVRNLGQSESPLVYYADLWGLQKRKYDYLFENNVVTTEWSNLEPVSPHFFLVPKDFSLLGEYEQGWSIPDVFSANASGVKTHRDHFVVDFEELPLRTRISELRDRNLSNDNIREKYRLKDTRDWKFLDARNRVQRDDTWESNFIRFLYRPFDIRFLYYSSDIVEWPRFEIMRHMLWNNLSLCTMRQVVGDPFQHALVSRKLNDMNVLTSHHVSQYTFPLYFYPDPTKSTLFDFQQPTDAPGGRRPNLDPDFTAEIAQRLDLRFIPDGRGDLAQTFGPEDIFHYIYAMFHAPTYRSRYAEFLKIDFPRVPLTSDVELFRRLCALGADLVALHLLEDDYAAASWSQREEVSPLQQPSTTFVERETGTTMGALSKSKCYQDGRVYLDTSQRQRSSYFEDVPEEVWNFHVGGYQVCRKWLYDRRGKKGQAGRTLTPEDIAHYQRVVVALQETIRLMGETDQAIEEHGGWPVG